MTVLQAIEQCRAALRRAQPACLVSVGATAGSVPRTEGAWMAVWGDGAAGTIGGGRLEFEAMAEARDWLARPAAAIRHRDYPLGPALGQCCGGRVQLRFEPLSADRLAGLEQLALAALAPVALFGGGHVGHALVRLLTTLPLRVQWIDSRDSVLGAFGPAPGQAPAGQPGAWPPNLKAEHSDPVHAAVRGLAAGSRVLAMSYSHAEDFDVVLACLERRRQRGDLPFIGLIGSRTKWATFSSRLRQRGYTQAEIDGVTCPIGVAGIRGKEPEVIAVAVAAQLLQQL